VHITHARARARAFVARRPRLRRALVALLALAAGGLVADATAGAQAARDAWGERRTVWVTIDEHVRGAALQARAVEAPLGLVPDGALAEVPVGALAHHDLAAGEMLTTADVATADDLVAAGRRGVAVPADDTTLPVRVGDEVDVVGAGRVIAAAGVVTEVGPTVVVVAVDADVAAEVAAAVVDRTAALVRAGG
jgi:hypothetical protein